MSPELISAIKERIELGHTKEMIKEELKTAGYDDATIESAYQEASEEYEDNGVVAPIPQAEPTLSQAETNTETAATLPGATDLFKKGWVYAKSRLDLVILLAVISSVLGISAYISSEDSTYVVSDNFLLINNFVEFAGVILSFMATYAVLYIISQTDERRVSISEGFSWAAKNLLPLIWVAILSGLVILGGFLLFIVPGIIVSIYVYFAQYVYVKEGKRGVDALLRSIDLVKGNWFSLFIKLLLVLLLFILVGLGVGLILGLIVGLASLPEVFTEVIGGIVGGIFSVVGIVIGFELYKSLVAAKRTGALPVGTSNRWKLITLAVLGLVSGPFVLIAIMGLGYTATTQIDEQRDMAEVAMIRMQMSTVKVQAELYRNTNNDSYVGFCNEVEDYVVSADRINCNADEDSFVVSASLDGQMWCSDSTGYSKSIAADIGSRTSCLEIPDMETDSVDEMIDLEAEMERILEESGVGTP